MPSDHPADTGDQFHGPSERLQAVTGMLTLFRALVLTLTFDNGMEFAGHREMARSLGAEVYFARPYRSCDRGLNEHANGLVRQYAGKAESLLEVDADRLRRAVELINHRPRKELGFKTPHEVFSAACRAAGIPPPPEAPQLCPD